MEVLLSLSSLQIFSLSFKLNWFYLVKGFFPPIPINTNQHLIIDTIRYVILYCPATLACFILFVAFTTYSLVVSSSSPSSLAFMHLFPYLLHYHCYKMFPFLCLITLRNVLSTLSWLHLFLSITFPFYLSLDSIQLMSHFSKIQFQYCIKQLSVFLFVVYHLFAEFFQYLFLGLHR